MTLLHQSLDEVLPKSASSWAKQLFAAKAISEKSISEILSTSSTPNSWAKFFLVTVGVNMKTMQLDKILLLIIYFLRISHSC